MSRQSSFETSQGVNQDEMVIKQPDVTRLVDYDIAVPDKYKNFHGEQLYFPSKFNEKSLGAILF